MPTTVHARVDASTKNLRNFASSRGNRRAGFFYARPDSGLLWRPPIRYLRHPPRTRSQPTQFSPPLRKRGRAGKVSKKTRSCRVLGTYLLLTALPKIQTDFRCSPLDVQAVGVRGDGRDAAALPARPAETSSSPVACGKKSARPAARGATVFIAPRAVALFCCACQGTRALTLPCCEC